MWIVAEIFFTQLIIKYLIENRLHPFHSKSNGGDGRSRVRHWTETHMMCVYLLYFYKSYRLQWKSIWIWLGMDKNKAKQNKSKSGLSKAVHLTVREFVSSSKRTSNDKFISVLSVIIHIIKRQLIKTGKFIQVKMIRQC